MSVWDTYENRMDVRGETRRAATLIREKRLLNIREADSLSFHTVTIDNVSRDVSIINSDILSQKTIISLPGEDLDCGGLVYFANNYWLITEKDANNEVYTKANMIQCNYLLKWVDSSNVIHQQWCIIEDGTKLRKLVSVQRNLYVKTSIELLEVPKARITTT